jgi:hypothetical protein
VATLAPAATYAASSKLASAPAPDSTTTSKPSFFSCSTVFGVAATRVSPARLSLGIPICMIFP